MKWEIFQTLIIIFTQLLILWDFKLYMRLNSPFTSLDPENLKIDFPPNGYTEVVIPATEIPGIPLSSVPSIDPIVIKPIESGTYLTEGERINLVDHSGAYYVL